MTYGSLKWANYGSEPIDRGEVFWRQEVAAVKAAHRVELVLGANLNRRVGFGYLLEGARHLKEAIEGGSERLHFE